MFKNKNILQYYFYHVFYDQINAALLSMSHFLRSICDPFWRNESEVARTNFELQAKEMKNVSFGRIWGFHKNEFNKPSSSDPSAPNIN